MESTRRINQLRWSSLAQSMHSQRILFLVRTRSSQDKEFCSIRIAKKNGRHSKCSDWTFVSTLFSIGIQYIPSRMEAVNSSSRYALIFLKSSNLNSSMTYCFIITEISRFSLWRNMYTEYRSYEKTWDTDSQHHSRSHRREGT